MSRFGGFRISRNDFFSRWNSFAIPAAASSPAPAKVQDFDYTKAQGIWTLRSTTQFPKKNSLYEFTNAIFTPGGAQNRIGPNLTQSRTGLTGTGVDAWKTNTEFFNNTNGIQLWTVPADGTYRIEVWGARGGSNSSGSITYVGGFGARMAGDFFLSAGSVIKILVGQMGGLSYGGGGGGTFVATNTNTPLIVAGGGNTTSPWSSSVVHAPTGTSGTGGSVPSFNGTNGSGGSASSSSAAGGAGFTGNGTNTTCGSSIAPLSFINGGIGGQTCNSIGGFGGGSASDGCCQGASGAGGGYSGGAGCSGGSQFGGAGGSYNIGTNQNNSAGNVGTANRNNHGQVIITFIS